MKIVGAVAMAVAVTVLVLTPAAWTSIYNEPYASFAAQDQPDPPLDQFAAGRLGLIQPSWGDTYLYVAYRYLAGPGFDANEQKVLLSVWNEPPYPQPDLEPQADWLAARAKIQGAPDLQTFDDFATVLDYMVFRNCNDDAFRTATATLQLMVAKFGASSPQVKQWLDAQDIVFQNCPGSKKNPYIPQPLHGGTRLELAQRAYQIASANFYSENFDTAVSMFTAIAANSTSPWRTIAPYLVARATIRKATLSGEKNDPALLAQAEKQLKAIVAGSGPDNLKASARRLLGFVGCRLHPEESHAEEVRAIMRPGSERTLAQDLKDYRECGTARQVGDYYADDLGDWIATFKSTGAPTHSIDKWKRTGSPAWLVASLAETSGSDPNAGALIKAAAHVEPSSPAYVTAEFHIDRILIEQGKNEEARARLDAILAKPDALPRSAYNQFSGLRLKLARNLDEYLRYALRYAVTIEGDAYPDEFNNLYMQELAPGPLDDVQQPAAGPLLDEDSAAVMDRWLPLSVLKQVARSQILPPSLRARVALSVLVRSILIGDRETVRELAPLVSDLIPALKPSLDAWLAAKTRDDERFEAALMILRNPGMRPYVESGMGRLTPLGKMNVFRGNWWGALIPPVKPTPSVAAVAQAPVPRYPIFLSDAERKSADREWTSLSAIDGPEVLCSVAIQHADVSPKDERVPEALYRCIYAVHLGPSSDRCDALAESAFHLLHGRYPNSTWAQENKFWYRGSGSPSQQER